MTRILLLAVAVLIAALGYFGWRASAANARADAAEIAADAAHRQLSEALSVIDTERGRVAELDAISAAELKGKQDAQNRADSLADALRAGDRRVRYEIAALHTAHLSAGAAATGELEAAAQRGADAIAAAVGVGAACDARVAALIAAYEVK